MMCPKILVFRTTMVFALEFHGLKEKHDQGPQGETGGCQHVTGRTCKHKDLNRLCPKISLITGHRLLVIINKSR